MYVFVCVRLCVWLRVTCMCCVFWRASLVLYYLKICLCVFVCVLVCVSVPVVVFACLCVLDVICVLCGGDCFGCASSV